MRLCEARGNSPALRDEIRKPTASAVGRLIGLFLRNLRSTIKQFDGASLQMRVVSKSAWRDAVAVYPHADFVDPYTIFNIKGNSYRLVVKIEYRWQIIFVKQLLTHTEYNRGKWKK